MPNSYSVLVGDPQEGKVSGPSGKPPHYLINVNAAGSTYQIAVNIESDAGDSQVLYNIQTNFQPPDASILTALQPGMNDLTNVQGNPSIDYVRSRTNGQPLVTLSEMQLLPLPSRQNSGNLQNAVIQLLNQATADPDGVIYAFGRPYTDGTGIHNIHMNQGNPIGQYSNENAIWQDGAVLFQLPATNTWTAIFIAFQGESWTTDDNGNPL
jgi:uncharacterized protein YukJ